MATGPDNLHDLGINGRCPELDLSWLQPDDVATVDRIRAGPRGMTLEELERGRDVLAYVEDFTIRPRDMRPRHNVVRTGQYRMDMSDVWSENTRLLYEEAIRGNGRRPQIFLGTQSDRCLTISSARCANSVLSSARWSSSLAIRQHSGFR